MVSSPFHTAWTESETPRGTPQAVYRPEASDVVLIPHTLEVTTLGGLRPGDTVNLEADVLGKYVKRYLGRILPDRSGT